MASFHCTVKAGASGSAAAHDHYIEREGKHKSKKAEDLEAAESGNLPTWAETSTDFWKASDQLERINAKGYREFELALPREMTKAQRLALVRDFVRQELGERHTYSFAIHNPRAALEGGEQPHAHIMFSERVNDGIARATPEHYFKQSYAKNPARGGCKKANSARKSDIERKAELVALRGRWADLQNAHLAKAGHQTRVDHRSLADQGIERVPTQHLGPAAAAMEKKHRQPTRRGQAHRRHQANAAELARIPALERQLDVDCAELARAQAEAAKPVLDAAVMDKGKADFRAKFEVHKLAREEAAKQAQRQALAEQLERQARDRAAEKASQPERTKKPAPPGWSR